MAIGFFKGQVVHGVMQNLDTAEAVEFLFNPTQLQKTIAVNYARQQTVGGSFEHLHFKNTGNVQMNLSLYHTLGAFVDTYRGGSRSLTQAELDRIKTEFESQRSFYVSLCYPAGRVDDPLRRAPPRALLLWPKNVALEVVVTRYQDTDTQFSMEMDTSIFTVNLSLEEHRRWRLTSAQARQIGFKRATGGAQGF